MSEETLLELLYAKSLKKTLKFMKEYEEEMKKGTSYEKLLEIMEYDYNVFLQKEEKLNSVDITLPDAIFKINEIQNIQTNIESQEDALCKIKALSIANSDFYE